MIATLTQQLKAAVERQQRWNTLRDQMQHGIDYEVWKRVADLNEAEINHLSQLLVSVAECRLRGGLARVAQ